MKPYKHNIFTLNAVLTQCGFAKFLKVSKIIDDHIVLLLDKDFGTYQVELKCFAPSMTVPRHKGRRFLDRVNSMKLKYIGTNINGLQILDVFYGPDKGLKNRSFHFEYEGTCGHISSATCTWVKKYKKVENLCSICSKSEHGERGKVNGERKIRTQGYIFWTGHKKELLDIYKDNYFKFKIDLGDKPFKHAKIVIIDGCPVWVQKTVSDDSDLHLIATAIRQAFRYSTLYSAALEKCRIETETATKFRCAHCFQLFPKKSVQVDHVVPIMDLHGAPLTKENIIDRIWTSNLQVLDRVCHNKKSASEATLRKLYRKERKNERQAS